MVNSKDLIYRLRDLVLEELYIKSSIKSYKERRITSENTFVIVSHPRGGSNWLGEICMQMPNSILIDEPFWRGIYRNVGSFPHKGEGKLKSIANLGFYYDQVIPVDAEWDDAKLVIKKILQGAFPNFDLWDKNELKQIKNVEKFIIKLCYGHLLVPWIHKHFDIKSIILHRHPCAVVSSQLQFMAFKNIPKNPGGTLPNFRFDEYYHKFSSIFNAIRTREEYLAAIWSIKTKFLLENPIGEENSITCYYEDLLLNYSRSVKELNRFFGVQSLNTNQDLGWQASSSIPNSGHLLTGKAQLEKWQKTLNQKQISLILEIVSKFEIDLYDHRPLPLN